MILLALLLIVVFWGFFFGPIRRAFYRGRVVANQVRQAEGALICPDCGGSLARDPSHCASNDRCAECGGRWLARTALEAALAKKNRPKRDWFYEKGRDTLACPKCGQTMQCGEFRGEDFPVFQCSPCDSFWMGRIEWISLEMRVLG